MNRSSACVLALLALGCRSEELRHSASAPTGPASSSSSSSARRGELVSPDEGSAHLPDGCAAAFRVDARAVLHNPRLGEPLLASIESGTTPDTPAEASFARMLTELDLKPSRDLDVLWGCVALGESGVRFTVAIAGKLPLGLIDAMTRHAPDPERFRPREVGGLKGLERDGRFLVQAKDGALVLGDDLQRVTSALTARRDPYQVSPDGELSVVALPKNARGGPGSAALLEGLERGDAVVRFGRSTVALSLAFADAARARAFETQLLTWVSQLHADAKQLPSDIQALLAPWLDAFDRRKSQSDAGRLSLTLELDPGVSERTLLFLLGRAVR